MFKIFILKPSLPYLHVSVQPIYSGYPRLYISYNGLLCVQHCLVYTQLRIREPPPCWPSPGNITSIAMVLTPSIHQHTLSRLGSTGAGYVVDSICIVT